MKTFEDYLRDAGVDKALSSVLFSLIEGVKKIAEAVNTGDTGKAGTQNIYGEDQVALDLRSNDLLIEELKKNSEVGLIASEELDDEEKIGEGEYALCFDPLDGSSLVDVNLAVGTIVGVYKAETFIGVKGDDQVAAVIVTYGPRTTMMMTVRKGVMHFRLRDGEFVLEDEDLKVGEGKMFAPGNLRACAKREDYFALVNFWIKNQYKLRYSGGMVPDVNQIFLKGKGIFTYPGYDDQPDGKLRLLVECAPMALLMEEAGGEASDGKVRILDKKVQLLDQRTPIYLGSKGEVERCLEYLK